MPRPLRRHLAALLLALLPPALPVATAAQTAEQAAGIEAVIRDQIARFADRDLPGAWSHASPAIQGIFGNPDRFGRMVEQGYPMVWDNRETRFLGLERQGDRLRQRVLMRDPEGRLWTLEYEMIEGPDGWKINGVRILRGDEATS